MKILTKLGITFLCIGLFGIINAFAQKNEPNMQLLTQEFWNMDTNKDGIVSPDEIEAYSNKRFSEMDKDMNEYLDTNEMKLDKSGQFIKADTNKDGKVTRQEAIAQYKKYFNEMDTNKDNKVTRAEYDEYWENVMKTQ